MKTKYYVLIAIGLFLIIAGLTNPGTEKHKEEVRLKMNTIFHEKSKKDDISQDENAVGSVIAQSMINMIVNNLVSSSNYILFSTTEVTFQGKTKTIGVGFLGNIFLSSKMDEALKE
ncbi:hypothetical protein ACFFLS_23890 [Flavobacterium procerum]|uniref:DUF4359 domain-containing protein n=1 Tax=Flavobacterium procerum TaxID=1455569 RepID=A0ABV6BXC9_9FLAO